MRIRSLVLLLLSVVLACACVGGATGPSGGGAARGMPSASAGASPAGPPQLDGRTFLSVRLTGRDLVKGTQVRLIFMAGRLSAQAGCNWLNGGYTVGDGGSLGVGDLATTDMACQDDRMAQDQWLAGFLRGAHIDRFDGANLVLAAGSTALVLVDEQTTNLPLEGTYWIVDGLVSGDAVASVPADVRAILQFGGGRVGARLGCNQGSGSATISGGRIAFGSLAMTEMACGAEAMSVERQVEAVLSGSQPYAIAGNSLRLGASGGPGLTLQGVGPPAKPSDPGPT